MAEILASPKSVGRAFTGIALKDDAAPEALGDLYANALRYLGKQPVELATYEEEALCARQAALLFIARGVHAIQAAGNGKAVVLHRDLPVAKIVAQSQTNLLAFFSEVSLLLVRLSSWLEEQGTSAEEFTAQTHLKEHAQTVVVLGLIVRKFKDVFNSSFLQLDAYKPVVLRMGWLMLLVLKNKLLSRFPDLVSCMELVLCVFAFLLSNSPSLPPSLMTADGTSSCPQNSSVLLKALAETYKYSSDFEKLSSLLGSTEAVLSTMLSAAVPEWRKQTAVAATASGSTADPWVTASAGALDMARMDSDAEPAPGSHSRASTGQVSSGHVAGSASAGGQEAAAGEGGSGGVNEDSATPAAHATGPCTSAVSDQQQQSAQQVRFPGLLIDLDRMNFVIAMLEREYESVYARQGELDERDFLSMDFNTMASPKYSMGSPHSTPTGPTTPSRIVLRSGGLLGPGQHSTHSPKAGAAATPGSNHFSGPFSVPPSTGGPNGSATGVLTAGSGGFGGSLHGAAPAPLAAMGGFGLMSGPASAFGLLGGSVGGFPGGFMGLPPGMQSPLPIMALGHPGQATPVSEHLVSMSWLRNLTTALPALPSPSLSQRLAACEPNPESIITSRVRNMAAAVMPEESTAALAPFAMALPNAALERRTEVLKLYFYVLEAVLVAEGRGEPALTAALVGRAAFHSGLLACCAEVVAHSYRMVTPARFPALLGILNIDAFDLSKLLHNFVKYLPTMPREVKRHIFEMEERIIESLAWQPGSSLYPVIIAHTAQQHAAQAQAGRERGSAPVSPAGGGAVAAAEAAEAAANNASGGSQDASPQNTASAAAAAGANAVGLAPAATRVTGTQAAGAVSGGSSPQTGSPIHAEGGQQAAQLPVQLGQTHGPEQQQHGPASSQSSGPEPSHVHSSSPSHESGQHSTQHSPSPSLGDASHAAAHAHADGDGMDPMETSVAHSQVLTHGSPRPPSSQGGYAAGHGHAPHSPKRPAQGQAAFSSMGSPAKKARGSLSQAIGTVQASLEEEGAEAEQAKQHLSGTEMPAPGQADGRQLLPNGVGVPPSVSTGGAPSGLSTSSLKLYDFLRKLLKLTAYRLQLLCEAFDFTPLPRGDVFTHVFDTMTHTVYNHTHLFYNRHIDQVLLSALYGFCKVQKLNQVSFKEIINAYKRQPHAQGRQEIFRNVVTQQSNPGLEVTSREDIIAFYNKVFVPPMKAFLLKQDASTLASTATSALAAAAAAGGGAGSMGGSMGALSAAARSGPAAGPGAHLPPLPPKAPPMLTASPGRRPGSFVGTSGISASVPGSGGNGGCGTPTGTKSGSFSNPRLSPTASSQQQQQQQHMEHLGRGMRTRVPSAIAVQARDADEGPCSREAGAGGRGMGDRETGPGSSSRDGGSSRPPGKIPTGLAALLMALQADATAQEDTEMANTDV